MTKRHIISICCLLVLFFLPKITYAADQKTTWTLIATGDIIPARSVNAQSVRKNNFFWAYQNIAPYLKQADLTVINLETPLLKNCPLTDEGMIFCGNSQHAASLRKAGIDLVSLANNHSGNYGEKGIAETVANLEPQNIKAVGLGKPVIIQVKNLKIGFLGYNDIEKNNLTASFDEEIIKKDLHILKKQTDLIIVFFHWGDEYVSQPTGRQKTFGHLAIDNGADLIIGNHPHWIQGAEIYKNKLIFYALGNTVFDQMWSEETKIGLMAKLYFSGTQIINIELYPTYIEDYGQPVFLTGKEKITVLQKFKTESQKLINQK